MNETAELTIGEPEGSELEAELDQCLGEIRHLRDECEHLDIATGERLRRIRRECEQFQERS